MAVLVAAHPGAALAVPIVDGITSAGEYSNSFIANWTNEHHGHGSMFNDGTDETTVWWDTGSASYFLFIEAPLPVKNMIWGNGVTAEELALYNVHNTHLESDGKNHHDDLTGIDYSKAVGSEKAIFAGIEAKLKDDSVKNASGLVDNATSRSYLLDNLICDMTNCAGLTTTMSFEFEFDLSSADFQTLPSDIQTNGIEFHLSPERGGPPIDVPAPATLWLMMSGILMLLATARRRRQIT